MAREVTNIAASVRARLQNVAKEKQANFQRMLTRYALERLLFRLSVSRYKDSFVLKGAMLYAAWLEDPFRTTRDLDLLSLGAREGERLAVIFRDICVQAVEEDGLHFDAEHIVENRFATTGPMEVFGYAHRLDSAPLSYQSRSISVLATPPGPSELEYPVLLDQPAPKLNAYPRDTVAAEKFEAMVVLDLANSRMKDFYDLLAMSRLFAFEGATLAAAIHATFERRVTTVPRERPPSLTSVFSGDPQKVQQWRAFLTREALLIDEPDLSTVIREVGDFIMPAARGAIDDGEMPGRWTSDGGWRSAT